MFQSEEQIENEQDTQSDEVPVNDSQPSHGEIDENEQAVDDQVSDHGSSSANDDAEVTAEELNKWNQIKESVQNEREQRKWRKMLQEDMNDYRNKSIDSVLRGVIIQENWTDSRRKTYKQLMDVDTTNQFTSDQIRLWADSGTHHFFS